MVAAAGVLSKVKVFNALRHPQYRRYWLGMVASVLGVQVMTVAQGWLVYDLSGSTLYLGYVGLATSLPAILLNLFGGVIADKIDRRKLLMVTQSTAAVLMGILATLTLTGLIQVWHVIAIAAVTGAVTAFDTPARQAIFPRLISREDLPNAVALNSMVWQGSRILGPSLAGVIIAQLGSEAGFYLAAVGSATMAMMVFSLTVPHASRAGRSSMAQDLFQGVGFVARNSIFRFLIGMTFFNSIFGMSYVFMLPVFAKDILGVGSTGLGFLHAMSGMGALLGTLVLTSMSGTQRKGWLLIGGAVLFGTFLVLFSRSTLYPLSLALVFLAGVAGSMYMISVMTTLQMLVPDELRGRVMGIYSMTYSMMPLGSMQSGGIASVTSAPFAVALGGVAVISFALLTALTNSQVRRLAPVPGPAVAAASASSPASAFPRRKT